MKTTKKIEKDYLEFFDACLYYMKNTEETSIEEVVDKVYKNYIPSLPSGEYKKQILCDAFKKFYFTLSLTESEDPKVSFTSAEVKFLRGISKKEIKELFYLLFFYKKQHEHPSGWIRFDFEEVVRPASQWIVRTKYKREDMSALVEYGFEMRSIGSKAAIPCFKLPDIEDSENMFEVGYLDLEQKWGEYINATN